MTSAGLLLGCLACGGGGSSTGGDNSPGTAVAPSITTQPANQSVTLGQTATFTVVASGTAPLSYQWKMGTSAISGATHASYTTPATSASDNGSTFTVTVSNSKGSVTSQAATLTTTAAVVSVGVSPDSTVLQPGTSFTFTATVSGSTNMDVTWSVQESGGGTVDASGKYTAPAAEGTYHVIATSAADGTTNASATVHVSRSTMIAPERVTVWNPGLNAVGGIPDVTTIYATIDAATYGNGTTDATAAINTAITGAGDKAKQTSTRQVVFLPTGTYRTTSPIMLNRSNVVLRGAGMSLTKIVMYSANQEPAISMGWFWPDGGKVPDPCINIVGSVPKGAMSITVQDASSIQAGDVLQIDQADDASYVFFGFGNTGGTYYKRGGAGNWPPSPGGLWRSMGQQIEVASKSGNTLTLSGPIHMAFDAAFQPQVFPTASSTFGPQYDGHEWGTQYIGLEDLYVTGGGSGNIEGLNLAYGWIKNVESDGNPATGPGMAGASIALDQCFRCEIRGCYVHHARQIVYGGGAYGIDIRSQSSNCLVEDNIAVWLDKPIVLVASGGGNVVAYNYVDQAIIDTNYDRHFQESGVDGGHNAFPHFELIEGNWTPNLGGDTTHGNTGWLTFFRNHAPGRNSDNLTDSNVSAAMATAYSQYYNFVGNVLLQPDLPTFQGPGHLPIYERTWDGKTETGNDYSASVYQIGMGGDGSDDGTALKTIFRHGNFDYVTNSIQWDPNIANHDLPSSLYLTSKPAFFGSNPWPWVTPEGANPLPGALPAKVRYEAMMSAAPAPYFTTQPAMNVVVTAGGTATFTVVATGSPTYKWQSTVNSGQDGWFDLANDATHSGVTTATLSIRGTTADLSSHWYRCVATNAAGSTRSHGANLTVN